MHFGPVEYFSLGRTGRGFRSQVFSLFPHKVLPAERLTSATRVVPCKRLRVDQRWKNAFGKVNAEVPSNLIRPVFAPQLHRHRELPKYDWAEHHDHACVVACFINALDPFFWSIQTRRVKLMVPSGPRAFNLVLGAFSFQVRLVRTPSRELRSQTR